MRTKHFILFLSLFAAFALTSCGDDDAPQPENPGTPAEDNGGSKKTNRPPEVDITNIVSGDVFLSGDVITVEVEASDPDDNLQQLRFYVDDVLNDSRAAAKTTFTVAAGALSAGVHTLRVAAMDEAGETANTSVTIEYVVSYIKTSDKVTRLANGNCTITYNYQVSPSFYSARVLRLYDNNGALVFFIVTHSLSQLTTIDTGAWTYQGSWDYSFTTYFMWSLNGSQKNSAVDWFRVSSQGAGFVIDAQLNSTTTLHYEGSIPITIS